MKAFETTATVNPMGELRVAGVPYSAGTQVDVIVSPKRASGDEFRRAWEQVCQQLRSLPRVQNVSDEEIQAEIAGHRAGR
jgi:hypothetical protein